MIEYAIGLHADEQRGFFPNWSAFLIEWWVDAYEIGFFTQVDGGPDDVRSANAHETHILRHSGNKDVEMLLVE